MRKLIIIFSSVILLALPTTAICDFWVTKSPMPTGRFGLSVTEVDGDIYAAGGTQFLGYWVYDVLSVVEKYNPAADTWETASPLPSPLSYHASVNIDGKIYVLGGRDLAEFSFNTVQLYDPLTDTWETKAPMPTARDSFACVSVNNKIYAIGGQISANNSWDDKIRLDIVEVYDPLSDSWETKSPMPTARSFLSAAAIGNKIYVIGGNSNNEGNLSVVEEYDIVTDSWQTRAPINIARSGSGSCALNGKISGL